jgi:histidinol-phosphate/aromatic aminotransferase/cobyric acid decarboxylase-like protein
LLNNKNLVIKYAEKAKKGKKFLEKYFIKNDIFYFSTAANFILMVLNNKIITKRIFEELLKNRILVVVEKNIPHYKNVIKFTVGPEFLMRKVVKAIDRVI